MNQNLDNITWGGRTKSAREWAEDPSVRLRGITLAVLQARLDPSVGQPWTHAQALETPVLDEGNAVRWAELLDPPKGRAGAEARALRKALLREVPELVPLHVLQNVRDDLRHARHEIGRHARLLAEGVEASAEQEQELARLQRKNGEQAQELARLQRKNDEQAQELAHLQRTNGELSALYGWWNAATEDTETPSNRIFDVLKRMFG